MSRDLMTALKASVLTFGLCSIVYPAVVWGLAQLLFPSQADGSLIYGADGRTVVGSELIAQKFETDRYFHPRPSAADYKADAASGSNLGTNNPDLHKAIADRAQALKATPENPVPADLVTASGSGLDPDVSLAGALFQAQRVALARGLPIETVRGLINRETNQSGAIIGAPPRVNVLLLNLALDQPPGVGR
jgi:potassium-transporting ATPase KdpC subunit